MARKVRPSVDEDIEEQQRLAEEVAGLKAERIEMLQALDVSAAIAFYNKHDLGGPREADKVMVRVHKERIVCADLSEEDKQVSRDWIAARMARGRAR